MRILPRLTPKQFQELRHFSEKTKDVKELKRAQAVLLLNAKNPLSFITGFTGYSRSQVFSLREQYVAHGLVVLRTKRKGSPKRFLTKRQLFEVMQILKTTFPPDHGYQTPFWTTSLLAGLIEEKFQVRYSSKTSYYLIFRKSRFSFHKPGMVSSKRDEQAVLAWRKQTTQRIQKAWREKSTIILCEDEAILSTQTTFQKVWLPIDDYPKVETTTKRVNKSIYGFLNIKTGKQHAFAYEKQNMVTTVKALQQVRRIYPRKTNKGNKLTGKKLLLLWDNPGWHRGAKVTEYIERDGAIEVMYFPKYAPEENPQEHVWKKAKSRIIHNRFLENIEKETKDFLRYLNTTTFLYKLLNLSPVS